MVVNRYDIYKLLTTKSDFYLSKVSATLGLSTSKLSVSTYTPMTASVDKRRVLGYVSTDVEGRPVVVDIVENSQDSIGMIRFSENTTALLIND